MGPEISGKQKSTPKPKRKFILGHPVNRLRHIGTRFEFNFLINGLNIATFVKKKFKSKKK